MVTLESERDIAARSVWLLPPLQSLCPWLLALDKPSSLAMVRDIKFMHMRSKFLFVERRQKKKVNVVAL